jgi:hypothetical protein
MKITIVAAFIALIACVTGGVFAGEMESLSAGAERMLSLAAFPGNAPGSFPTAPAENADKTSDYKKLAAAFEKGTAPTKEALAGWNAGRFLDRDYPGYPGSLLLAGGETQPVGEVFKLVPFKLAGSPDFYERLSADIIGGVAIMIRERQAMVTIPALGPAEVTFELILPSYNKGFSRYAIRKAADNRILVKHAWKDDLGSTGGIEGLAYGYFTKDVTPKP